MKKRPSVRQVRYAYGLMNHHKSKQQVALEAGFSESTARVPKSIENKLGFKLAMAQLAGEMENVTMKLMFELQARDMSKMSNKDLLQSLDVMSKTHERFYSQIPEEMKY
ncbi:MAG: hypothetical protein V4665_04265 [Patescibacteria group bacterium]